MSQNSQGSRSKLLRRSSIGSNTSKSSNHSNSTISDSAVFSQRIVSVDCYTSFPIPQLDTLISDFRGTEVNRVPVIRIYGATPRGQKTCTHVHGVFPYIYVEDNSDEDDFEYMLALALDNAINGLFNSYNTYSKPSERTIHQHVFKITRVRGRSFYGYKSTDRSFVQIFFYSPISLKKGVELLESGRILGQRFQPYEAHIPYILQFFLDYKLYGMNFIHFREVKFRRKDDSTYAPSQLLSKTPTTTGCGSKTYWDLETMPEEYLLPPKVTPRCRLELEIDVKAVDILVSGSAQGKNPGIVDIWLDEKERRRQNSMTNWGNITIPQSPDRSNETDFIFPRESELLGLLGEFLSGDKDVSSLMEASQSQQQDSLGYTPSQLPEIDTMAPSVTPDRVGFVGSDGRRQSTHDEEILDLLEDIVDVEDNDSILQNSQSQRTASSAPSVASQAREFPDDDDELMEDEWAEDFLSQSTLDMLDKWEQERNNEHEDYMNSYDDIHQCDGQFDDSDDEIEIDKATKRRKLIGICGPSRTKNNALHRRSPEKQSGTRTLAQFKQKVLSQLKVSGSDGSDSDCQILSVQPKPGQSKASSPSKRLRTVSIEIIESDSETNNSKSENHKPVKKPSLNLAKKIDAKSSQQNHNQNKEAVEVPNDDKDSGITSFYDVSHFPRNHNDEDDSDSSQEILPASPVKVKTQTKRRPTNQPSPTLSGLSPHSAPKPESPSVHDSLITSIYNYGDESMFNDEDPSQSDSIVSVYEYSNPHSEKTNSEDPDKSFRDIVVDFSVPNIESCGSGRPESIEEEEEQSEYDSEDEPPSMSHTEESDPVSVSEFQRQRLKHQIASKARRQQVLAARSMLRPSIFPFEIHPLKQTPLTADVEKWCQENAKNVRSQMTTDSEPLSLQYVRGATVNNETRTKLIGDICRLAKAIQTNQDKVKKRQQEQAKLAKARLKAEKTKSQTVDNIPSVSDSDDSDEDAPAQQVKAFRFRGAGAGEQAESGSSGDDDDDNDTIVASPGSSQLSQAPSPAMSSQGDSSQDQSNLKTTTPKSILVDRRRPSIEMRKKRLDFFLNNGEPASPVDNIRRRLSVEWPKYNPDDSELDSVSNPRSSTTPKANEALNSSNLKHAKASHEHQFLTTFAVEVHCSARADLVPDPEHDSVLAIFYAIHHDSPDNTTADNLITGSLFVDPSLACASASLIHTKSEESFPTEILMIQKFINLVQSYDPDLLVGYEIEKFSWGYLIQRGLHLGINMMSELSRILPFPGSEKYQNMEERHQWNETINGRIVFNLWKLLRHELAVTSYTYESMVLQILHQKVHKFPYKVLHNYWHTGDKRPNVETYFRTRVVNCMRIIDKLDLVNRTSELARLFGIQFFEVLSRGSQFRVESMMLRLTKPIGLIPPSPNPMQRARMRAPEYLPLILEPESKFYTDPVAVLDFQSLYPSMMIAYNYCFSTCIGRVEHFSEDGEFDLGCLQQEISKSELARLYKEGLIHISPCRVAFVKSSVKKGILSTMLEQILDTRQMVKRSMKKWKDNETLQKVLDSRQLGLKLIANVTYGYTSANWSGRMPCVEIADSIVSKGRETLQRAIDYVKENEHILGGRVIYGDTDSLFVLFPGKNKQEAFTLAQQIVDDVTQANPKPVKLKLEKIYQPCILQTKKRYVGFAYETPDQKEPKYDAKGIETVRRDGCPATAKILEGTIRVLFTKQSEDAVKEYVTEQFRKIFLGRVSLSNYTFARKFRGRSGYKPGARVPSLEIARKLAEKDKRAEPLSKERVPYIVTYGNPWAPLVERVRRPEEFINDPNLRLNAHYYIEKAIIPALNRCLTLAGLNANKWLLAMPRKYLKSDYVEGQQQKKGTIDQYFVSQKCIKCESRAANGFCHTCFTSPRSLKEFLMKQNRNLSLRYEKCLQTCQDCSKETDMLCINMDCPVKHKFLRYERDYRAKLPKVKELQNRLAVLDW